METTTPVKPKLPRRRSLSLSKIALLILLLGLVIGFGSEVAKLAYIGLSRATDKAETLVSPPIFERNYEDVIQANTEQAVELEKYLEDLRNVTKQSPESLGLDFSSEANYLRSREKVRSFLASSLLYPPPGVLPARPALSLVRLAENELATYYELSVPVLKGVHARGLFMIPRSAAEKAPLIIAAHGRGGMPARPKNGKLTLVGRSNRDLALGALKKGYAVWEPTFVFFAKDRPDDFRERLDVRAKACGTTLPAIEIAKIIGGLDALLERPEIDTTRVAMVGLSYGGFYTLHTTALEDRIRVAVVGAYFNDRQAVLDSSEPFGRSDWRFQHSLSVFHDVTMAALICPRSLQIQAGDHDQLFPIEGVRKTVPAARDLYERLNIGERFSFVEFVGRHEFNGEEAWKFVERSFNPASAQVQPRSP